MKKIIFLIYAISLFHQLTGAQWVQQESGVTTPLYNVQFVNRWTGWVTGSNSVILKTTNGGANWFSQTIDLVYPKRLYGLFMVNETIGYIAGGFETILKTTNSGINWNIISNIPTNDGNSNNAVSFINTETGWICSFLGRVLKTTNGGVFWDTSNVGNTGPLRDIQFLNTQTGWVCGEGGNLKTSTNGGLSWLDQPLLTTANLTGLHFINENTGWIVSEQDNFVFRTTNGGVKWDTAAQLPGGSLLYSYTIYFTSEFTGYIGGTSTRLFKSIDGGVTWSRDNVSNLGFISNFSFYNDTIGWAVGGGGLIIHTTNGGTIVPVVTVNENLPEKFVLFSNYPNPFNPATKISFSTPRKEYVVLAVYDILGKKVRTLVNGVIEPGMFVVTFDGSDISSGIYIYMLTSGKIKLSRKMILMK